MAQSLEERRAKAAAEKERIFERLRKIDAREKQLKVMQRRDERKQETRRKIITGAAVGAAVRDGVVSPKLLAHVLDKYVTKEKEREFMGLPPREKPAEEETRFPEAEVFNDDFLDSEDEGLQYFTEEELAEMRGGIKNDGGSS